ncbi:hypothetical protein KY290_010778 [Solanum tuberosum]|uniref:HAT C-terminal dimerisation domain-containing protein n=1 Tax=Solanum tuberosum TaxID=4113 RepID=A0ABQ7W002_SOLTU|nr:hypothetical protein KY290_010778 [Solanum tuberosum]
MCLAAHWIDSEWVMHKRILNFCPVSSHRGVDMANEISKYLREWGLDKKFTIIVDNVSSNDVTIKEFSKQFTKRGTNFMIGNNLHVRCMAHIINLIVQDGRKKTFVSIEQLEFVDDEDGIPTGTLLSNDWDQVKELQNSFKSFMISLESSLSSSSNSTIQSTGSLGSFMDDLMKHKARNGAADSKTELQKYLSEENEVESSNFKILSWWKINSPRFHVLAEMARDVLVIPISSVASECAFSTGGRILDSFRSSLTPKLVQTLVCLQDWIRSESRPVSVEENLDILEQLEQGNPI